MMTLNLPSGKQIVLTMKEYEELRNMFVFYPVQIVPGTAIYPPLVPLYTVIRAVGTGL